ncbi:MAG: DUF4870 domain-containing protein [Methanosarcinales archaeon]|nr:DUF4870 domain-containing protein [Methanosarcinales archaeon]
MNETVTTENNDNLMAAVAYVLGLVSGLIIYLIEKDKPGKSKFIMFHAMQSIILSIALIAFGILLSIIAIIPIVGWIIAIIAGLLFPLIALVLWIFLMYKAYSGEEYHLPVIGEMAEKYI